MIHFFSNLNPIIQSFIAGVFTFSITTLGSAVVFFFRKVNKNIMDSMLAISAGIMLSASYFSLLNPAIDLAGEYHMKAWLVVTLGFIIGGLSLFFADIILKHFSFISNSENKYSFHRCIMLFLSITLHNIPEGLVLGVSFGASAYQKTASLISAIILTIGIAIQNFPEGAAISLPMRRENISRWRSFLFGSFSAIVEPIFAIVGAVLILKVRRLLPFILSFTAGAMIFVTVMELIPESQNNEKKGLMTLFNMLGFSIMMILELLLG